MFKSRIIVQLRKSILDPQGKAVEHGVHSLGYQQTKNVRIGKFIEMEIDAPNEDEAKRVTEEVCKKLLANPVMEDFTYTIEKVSNNGQG
ncbi:MAG TPA: phosphoribosylformylglycinamidine synthase subunit PurS [Bacteroidota bacterium]|nr:phosphoribosylformylglycinamidine synthase subunit PurS [Bacteroidota bacterium]